MKARSLAPTRPDQQPRLLLVAHDGGGNIRKDRNRAAVYSELDLEDMALLAAREALYEIGTKASRDRGGPFLQLHQHSAHPFGGDLAVGRTGPAADPQLLRHRRSLRWHALRLGRSHTPAAGNRTPRDCRLRGKVLRQDRNGAHFPHDLRRWCRCDGYRPCTRRSGLRYRDVSDLRQRPVVGGELDHLAESRVRQQHHRLWARGEITGEALPDADDQRT